MPAETRKYLPSGKKAITQILSNLVLFERLTTIQIAFDGSLEPSNGCLKISFPALSAENTSYFASIKYGNSNTNIIFYFT